uniref:Leucine-rich repeat-containing N-terminal plant-type domain-containing protein n=1 Tax=Opuntia streptacantha TaxID=393608 RepID=A0A7C9DFG2_OPUST
MTGRLDYQCCCALFLMCVIAHLSLAHYAADASSGNETDRLALLEFKAKITVEPLGIMGSWNDTSHFYNWFGVTCSKRHQRVPKLNLYSLELGGSISPHIRNMTFLRTVDINEIPQEIYRLFEKAEAAISV